MNHYPILLVEDDLQLRTALAETLRLADYEVLEAEDGSAALRILDDAPVVAVVTDYQMKPMDGFTLLKKIRRHHPQLPVLMITAHGTIPHAVQSILEGATDYLIKPFSAQLLMEKLEQIIPQPACPQDLLAADPATIEVLGLAHKVAASDTTVLLHGESGTGKEVFARMIHQESGRAKGPFVALNCAAIPETMLEALLFGHEKGAFTGAHESRPGKFEQAQQGTLLLDEISEMDIGLQAKLLRVLQEREVERIGGKRSIALDVRVIATSNRDLRREVSEGRFREDLYYRLSVFPITLPPLRQRPADIIPLAQHFLHELCAGNRPVPTLSEEAGRCLLRYEWPGNVRELQNLVQRALILSSGHTIRSHDLRFEGATAPRPEPEPQPAATSPDNGLQESMQTVEGRLILDALSQGGSRKQAAELLGISPRTLRYKIARLRQAGIRIPDRGAMQSAVQHQ